MTTLYVYVSGVCNLACQHCWTCPQQEDAGVATFLPFSLFQAAIQQAKPLGLHTIKFTGGEPTCHPQLRDMASAAAAGGIALQMETNGTLIDQEMAVFMKSAPFSFVSVSIDGTTPDIHDALRGISGSFRRAVAGVRSLVSAGLPPQVSSVVHRRNVDRVGDMITFARDLGCSSVNLLPVQKLGRGRQYATENGLSVPEVLALFRRVRDDLAPSSGVRVFLNLPPAFHRIQDLLYDAPSRCGIKHILGVLATGQLSMCGIGTTIPDLVYGDLRHDDLRSVWCHHSALQELRRVVPSRLEGVCGDCIHRDTCLAVCLAMNYQSSRSLLSSHPFCQRASELGLFPISRLTTNRKQNP